MERRVVVRVVDTAAQVGALAVRLYAAVRAVVVVATQAASTVLIVVHRAVVVARHAVCARAVHSPAVVAFLKLHRAVRFRKTEPLAP